MIRQTRREIISSTASALLITPARRLLLNAQAEEDITQEYRGDPDLPDESITYSAARIRTLLEQGTSGRATFARWEPALPAAMLTTARSFIGHSRATHPEVISEFLNLFGLPLKDSQDRYVAYCAAGLSYAAIIAYTAKVEPKFDTSRKVEIYRSFSAEVERYYFMPSVSCIDMMNGAKAKRRWVARAELPSGKLPQPGWVVLFDWSGKGVPNHCGIVQNATAKNVFTVEFNTSRTNAGSQRDGGAIADRTREYGQILGFINTSMKPGPI